MKTRVFLTSSIGFLLVFMVSSCYRNPTSWEAASPGALISPVQDTVNTDRPEFIWHKGSGEIFMIEIDDRNTFITPIAVDSVVMDTVWTPEQPLPQGLLYWRVRSKRTGEPWGKWSDSAWFFVDTNPYIEISSVELPGYSHDLYVDGDILYVANGEAGLSIVSLSNPEAPVLLSNWDDPTLEDYARGIWKLPGDTLVYIADTDGGIIVINVKNPSNPVLVSGSIGTYNIMDVQGITYDNLTYVFATREDEGIQVYDASYPMALQYQGTRPITGYARGLFIKENTLYVAQGQAGIAFLDISNPDSILVTQISTIDIPGDARNLYIDDRNIAYVAIKEEGLALVDLSIIPHLISVLDFNGYVWAVVTRNDTAFLAAGGDGFQAVDCSNPNSPSIIGGVNTDYMYSVTLYGDFIIAGGRRGIHIIKRRW